MSDSEEALSEDAQKELSEKEQSEREQSEKEQSEKEPSIASGTISTGSATTHTTTHRSASKSSQRSSRTPSIGSSAPTRSAGRSSRGSTGSGETKSGTKSDTKSGTRSVAKSETKSETKSDNKSHSEDVAINVSLGTRFDCGISMIRKYLCFFVFIDTFLHLAIYLTYLAVIFLLEGDDTTIMEQLQCQMKCYSIETSFIEVALLAFARLVILEISYGMASTNSWAPVTLTTATTSLFILVKPFCYDWEREYHKTCPIILIIITVILSWLEAVLIDYRLITMEELANQYAEGKPDSYKKDLPRLRFHESIGPITNGLFRSILYRSNSLTLVPCRSD